MSILSMVYVDHAGNLALTAGNAKRTGTIKHERIVYPFGGFPVCAVNENRRVFPVQGIPEPLVPVVFQGCVLQVNEQQFSAVLLEDASLYQAFNASL